MPGDMLDIVVIPIKIVPVDQRAVLYSSIYHGIYRMKPEAWVACSPGRVEELFVNLTRKVPKPLSVGEVASLVGDISAWTIHSPGPGEVLSAIELHVRSLLLVSTYARPDALWRSQLEFWRWLAEVAPSERAFLEGFFTRPRLLDHISRGVRP